VFVLNSIVVLASLPTTRRAVRANFYISEVGFIAIARSCEALENGVSPTWISTTTRSHRAAAVLLPFAKKVVHGKDFSMKDFFSWKSCLLTSHLLRTAGGWLGRFPPQDHMTLGLLAHLVAQNDKTCRA